MACGASLTLPESGETLRCDLEAGHYGPVHSDHGHAWGDPALLPSHHRPDAV